MKLFLLILVTTSLSSSTQVDESIIGTWHATVQGVAAVIQFKNDSTFNVFVNKKTLASGKYTYSNGTITYVEDNGCLNANGDNLKGVYKVDFFTKDSIRFQLEYDSCARRKETSLLLRMGRVKT